MRLVERPPETLRRLRGQDQMDVVGHQAIGPHRHPLAPACLPLGAVESGMAAPNSEAVQWLPSGSTRAESRPGRIGPITLEAKQTGERSAGNPHAAFDEAGAGNVARPRSCDTRRRKSEPTGNTNFGLNRRASPRPYR